MPELPRVPAKLTLVSQAALKPGEVVRVSLTGQSVATGWRDEEHEYRADAERIRRAHADGRVEQIAATDLQFLDDTRVLLLRAGIARTRTRGAHARSDRRRADGAPRPVSPPCPVHRASRACRAMRCRARCRAARHAVRAAAVRCSRDAGGRRHRVPGSAREAGARDAMPQRSPRVRPRRSDAAAGATADDAATAAARAPRRADRVRALERLSNRSRPTRSPTGRSVSRTSSPDASPSIRAPAAGASRASTSAATGCACRACSATRCSTKRAGIRTPTRTATRSSTPAAPSSPLTYDWPTTLLGRIAPRLAALTATSSSADVSLWRTEAARRTPLVESDADVTCHEAEVNAGSTICLAFDGIDTRIWAIDADQGALRAVGFLPGRAYALSRGLDGSVLVWWRRRPVIVHPRSPRAIELDVDAALAAEWRGSAYTSAHLVVAGSGERAAAGLSTYEIAIDERAMPGSPARAAADRAMLDGR